MTPFCPKSSLLASGGWFCAYLEVPQNNKALYKFPTPPQGMNPRKTQTNRGNGPVCRSGMGHTPTSNRKDSLTD